MLFYDQPLGSRFGTSLVSHLEEDSWKIFSFAVAWVRESGVKHLEHQLKKFLQRGGIIEGIIGIDLENTTKEGLERLLSLTSYGDIRLNVYHNESGYVFHPKIYMLRDEARAKVIVGSNNLTESGLFKNTEASIEIDESIESDFFRSVENALNSWKDPSTGLSKQLDQDFLKELVENKYVPTESEAKARIAARNKSGDGKARKKLFGSLIASAPSHADPKRRKSPPAIQGQVLLMRLRKAHPVNRPTQTQLPKALFDDSFFKGVTVIKSAFDNSRHTVSDAYARGSLNTKKLEIPEMRAFSDPVARFERTDQGVLYEVYDSKSKRGQIIMKALSDGLHDDPPSTNLTKPKSPKSSTWWRFI